MAPITHIVMFEFKPDTPAAKRKEFSENMLGLKTQCVHPTSQKPYILHASGGTNKSIENFQHGITHAFVVQFDSVEDRDYYVQKDPAHAAFVQSIIPYLTKPYVIDFTPGEFGHGEN